MNEKTNVVPEQWSEAVEHFTTIIDSYTGLTVVERGISTNEVSFLCRQVDLARWRTVSARFLLSQPDGWGVFIGQRLVRTVRNGQAVVVDPWYLGFKADDVVALLQQAGALLIKVNTQAAVPAPGAAAFAVPPPAPAVKGRPSRAKNPKVDPHRLPTHPITVEAAERLVVKEPGGFRKTYTRPESIA